MKLSKTKNYLTALVLGTLFLSASVVDAVQPKLKPSDIVTLLPSEANMFATKRATTRLTQSHYRKFQLDDEFSEKIFDRYLKGLDFNRNTFLQSDIDDLRAKYGKKIDDELNAGNLDIAFNIYDLMMKRRYERYRYALSLLDKEPALNDDTQIEIDREKAAWPKTEAEADKLWEARVKNDIINLKLKDKK